jgi:hypothetical protein
MAPASATTRAVSRCASLRKNNTRMPATMGTQMVKLSVMEPLSVIAEFLFV